MSLDLQTAKQRLDEALAARHKLMTGAMEVSVSVGDYGDVKYARVDVPKLERYIAELRGTVARLEGRARRAPIRPRF